MGSRKILIAGVGNVLHGDDGFGVAVANRLMNRRDMPASAKVIETGIGGMSLVQELMYGYGLLVILDAYKRGGTPGQLYQLEPVLPDLSGLTSSEKRDYFADTHYATPMRALGLLAHVAALPETIRIIGCEPEEILDLRIGLSPPVLAAVEDAAAMAVTLVTRYHEAGQSDVASVGIAQTHPLSVIVGAHRMSPCDYDTYARFKLWVAATLTDGTIDTYRAGNVSIAHWDDSAGAQYPHLLNPCECGTFLPIEIEPGPMLASAIGLLSDLHRLKNNPAAIPAEFNGLIDSLMQMAERSLATNTALEIR